MTGDEARDLFSEAYDGDLDKGQRAAFDAALQQDEVLAFEYDEFVAIFDGAHAMDTGGVAPPDLLPGVQRKLRERSRGRYYRDVFAERPKPGVAMMPMVVACILILLTLLVYFGLHFFQAAQVEQDGATEPSSESVVPENATEPENESESEGETESEAEGESGAEAGGESGAEAGGESGAESGADSESDAESESVESESAGISPDPEP